MGQGEHLKRSGSRWTYVGHRSRYFSSKDFPYFGSTQRVVILHALRCFFSLYFFLLHILSQNISTPQSWSSYLSVSLPSSFVCLSTCPNHLSVPSLIFILIFAIPAPAYFSILFMPLIHLTILISHSVTSPAQPFAMPRSHFHTLV